jgi:hypothetical protein
MKRTLVILSIFLILGAIAVSAQISPSRTIVTWGKPLDGLKVGISCDTQATDSRKLPALFLYVANEGDREIQGIIQSGAECIVSVNGRNYAQESGGGKMSWMPPGRKYGPIPIEVERLRQIPELQTWQAVAPRAHTPELLKGSNTIFLYYMLENQLVKSGAIEIVLR